MPLSNHAAPGRSYLWKRYVLDRIGRFDAALYGRLQASAGVVRRDVRTSPGGYSDYGDDIRSSRLPIPSDRGGDAGRDPLLPRSAGQRGDARAPWVFARKKPGTAM